MIPERPLSETFKRFFASGKSTGVLLIVCTALSLAITNSPSGDAYLELWHTELVGLSLEHWINDGLMAVFFLLIGLELERELYVGELSDIRNALLPMVAAAGGVGFPALLHFAFNARTPTFAGFGIPMATDIAFALGILVLLGSQVPASLKVFLAALAVADDLAAIVLIAAFYTAELSVAYLFGTLLVFALLLVLNRLHVLKLSPYLLGGALMWFLMLKSGVHATIAGVLLAFAIPFESPRDDQTSPSHRLEHALHRPVGFLVLPIFALANTGIFIDAEAAAELTARNSLGIMAGLLLGKPAGITLLSLLAVSLGICRLPADMGWKHVLGAGILGGVGFTMSIFITNLAFSGQTDLINASKLAIMLSSLVAGTAGFLWLKVFGKPLSGDEETDVIGLETRAG